MKLAAWGLRRASLRCLNVCRPDASKCSGGQEQWLEEFRYYRREDGLIVKERDDLISSTRYAIMMRRSARQTPSVERFKPKPTHSGWAA
jgi:hypothetical protein